METLKTSELLTLTRHFAICAYAAEYPGSLIAYTQTIPTVYVRVLKVPIKPTPIKHYVTQQSLNIDQKNCYNRTECYYDWHREIQNGAV